MFKNKSNFAKIFSVSSLMILMIIICFSSNIFAITAEEIINKRDENEYFATARLEAEMIIINGGRKMKKEMISLTDGEAGYVEFINPRDKGTKYLKKGDNLWMSFPDAEDVVKISGHMMNQGMMGSDFSYQDIMESNKLTELYNFEIIDEEGYEGRKTYVLEGIAKEGKEVSYYRRKVWVDKERFIALREELYAQSGRLLKVSRVTEVDQVKGRYFPVRSVMENKLRENTSTEFIIKNIDFNPEIKKGTFTLENLR